MAPARRSAQWSHDGVYAYFRVYLPGEDVIDRVRISDHKLEEVVNLRNFRDTSSAFGTWMGIDAEDEPLLVRDAGAQDIHALTLDLP